MNDRVSAPTPGDANETPKENGADNEKQSALFKAPSRRSAADSFGIAIPPPQRSGLLPDLSQYTLTIGEAIDRFAQAGHARLSDRTMQRYCQSSAVDCYKITTTRDGKPITEWLVNETSLRKFIESRPTPGDAKSNFGVASENEKIENNQILSSDDMATPEQVGDAMRRQEDGEDVVEQPDDIAPPSIRGDAKSERRTLAELLIENARLTAELDGRDALLNEMLEDRTFLREELRDARKLRGDVREIAERTLKTLETIALGGKITELPEAPRNQGDNRSERFRADDVE